MLPIEIMSEEELLAELRIGIDDAGEKHLKQLIRRFPKDYERIEVLRRAVTKKRNRAALGQGVI